MTSRAQQRLRKKLRLFSSKSFFSRSSTNSGPRAFYFLVVLISFLVSGVSYFFNIASTCLVNEWVKKEKDNKLYGRKEKDRNTWSVITLQKRP